MHQDQIIEYIKQRAYEKLSSDSAGHDFYHVERVAQVAKQFAKEEGADGLACVVAGYLHDYCRPDEKERGISHSGKEALISIETVLKQSGLDEQRIQLVLECIAEHEHRHYQKDKLPATLESRILQDADRLDAIGAIGIARVFMYAGAHGDPMYLPQCGRENFNAGSAIGHFYDKLLHLQGILHTQAGRELAQKHQKTMEEFLHAFYVQWESSYH